MFQMALTSYTGAVGTYAFAFAFVGTYERAFALP
jgi:hypothetical protein